MCDLVFSYFVVSNQGRKHVGLMLPTRAFCVARYTFWEFSSNLHLRCLVHSPVFKIARLASEQLPSERTNGYKRFA